MSVLVFFSLLTHRVVENGSVKERVLVDSNSRVAHREEGLLRCLAGCFLFFSLFAQGCCSVDVIKALACLCYF